MTLTLYTGSFTFYTFLQKTLYSLYDKKKASNYVSFIHALGAVILTTLYKYKQENVFYRSLQLWSTGYLTTDTLSMVRNKKFGILHLAYMYHHLATLYIIHKNPQHYMGNELVFWGELSNLPTYFVYHYLHTIPPDVQKIMFWKWVQKYFYTIIRIPIVGVVAYRMIKNAPTKGPVAVVAPIYLMGVIWTAKILRQSKMKRLKE